MIAGSVPILSCDAARDLEVALFGGDEAKEWQAMQKAGRAIAAEVLRDFHEIGGFPSNGRVLVLVGKGHNGGDALITASEILRRFPAATADVLFAFGEQSLRPLTAQSWREAAQNGRDRWSRRSKDELGSPSVREYDLCLDGMFGFQFRPPADAKTTALLKHVNALLIRLRAAVDLPSADLFRADFTYATGSVKQPVIDSGYAGRIRYLDLGFFDGSADRGADRVLTREVLRPLAALRPARCDKRSYGHLFVVGGSRNYPGAVLMAVEAALHAGTGLVSAFVPESLYAAYAARVPEAMWVGCPETPTGGLALEGMHLIRERLERATAFAIGPGIGREPETQALIKELITTTGRPTLLDADALQPELVRAAKVPLVLTPHAGEFSRIAQGAELREFVQQTRATVVLKGPITQICSAGESNLPVVYHSLAGGPVLARGGSGDLLAGMIGGLLAQEPSDLVLAAARGAMWHGLAADALARARGQVAVTTTQLLEFLPSVLRELCS
jgi:NAD(P)H-hydrate epimerase